MELKGQPSRVFDVQLVHDHDYVFRNTASENGKVVGEPYLSDEPDPIGGNEGPSTPAMLGSAIGHCLSASLLEYMITYGVGREVAKVTTDARIHVANGPEKAPRIQKVDVEICADDSGALDEEQRAVIVRSFQRMCTVSSSLKAAIEINVNVIWALAECSRPRVALAASR